MEDRKMARAEVRQTVGCPECGALVGEPCVGARGKERTANHQARLLAAEDYAKAARRRETRTMVERLMPGRAVIDSTAVEEPEPLDVLLYREAQDPTLLPWKREQILRRAGREEVRREAREARERISRGEA